MSRSQPTQTLFLPELPADLSEAELERTFRGFVGFESCRLRNDRTGKLVGFVEFECVDDAVHARDSMQASSPFSGEPWNVQFSTNQNRGPAPKRLREDSGQSRHDVLRSNVGAPAVVPRPPYPTPPLPPGSKGSSLPALAPPPPIPPGYRVPTPPSLEPPPPLHYHPPLSPYGTAAIPPSSVAAYPRPPLPPDASSTLYVECLPPDITEREVAHIFRRFEGQGYQSIRVFPKEGKSGPLLLCFVEFDSAHQAYVAMQALQGYRLDLKSASSAQLKISFSRRKDPRPVALPPPTAFIPPPLPMRSRPAVMFESTPVHPGGHGGNEGRGRVSRWSTASGASAEESPMHSPSRVPLSTRERVPRWAPWSPQGGSPRCAHFSGGYRRDGREHRDGVMPEEEEDDFEYEAHAGEDAMESLAAS
mmetsp:Transcript_16959/g.47304  ORF Transcript_16959/g.47304 Transcript_16959/m.47304 type:complete len:418 (-) Transcript_16959:275-1528(-)